MAATKIINNIPVNLQSGSQILGPANVNNNTSTVVVRLARCTSATPSVWPDGNTTIDCVLQIDNGLGFQDNDGFAAKGGIAIRRDGTEAIETTFTTQLPPGTNRKARVILTVKNGPLVSSLTVEVS